MTSAVFAFKFNFVSTSVFVYVVCIAVFIWFWICVAALPYNELAVKSPQVKSNWHVTGVPKVIELFNSLCLYLVISLSCPVVPKNPVYK